MNAANFFFPTAFTLASYENVGSSSAPAADRTDAEESKAQNVQDILGKDAFLQLLTTQLRYQDPLKPIDDQNFIAQMAQFSALEQMQNLTSSLERFMEHEWITNRMAQATALLGREVEVVGEKEVYRGVVDAVKIVDGIPRIIIDDVLFDVDDVISVHS